ncbi:MAG: leucine-rich repeat domain-containing protein, partial [Treponema sp.]|nr:leucine-rich repeat domain-containing protein [Treponema sp.]
SLPHATSIGKAAFSVCTDLETLSLPQATDIGNTAFYVCTALETISLPKATDIGDSAFFGCTALTTMDLPKAATIKKGAFDRCTALTTVNLSAATTIENEVFSHTGAQALTVTLGTAVPTLEWHIFALVDVAKPVTVRVPAGAAAWSGKTGTFSGADTTDNWGNGFRGGGWNGSALLNSSPVNSNITLTIETY